MVPPFTIPDEAEVQLNLLVLVCRGSSIDDDCICLRGDPIAADVARGSREPLRSGGRTGSTRESAEPSGGLVVIEVGLSLMLLVDGRFHIRVSAPCNRSGLRS